MAKKLTTGTEMLPEYILGGGFIEKSSLKDSEEDEMLVSGFLTTEVVDYAKHKLLTKGAEDTFGLYKSNPIVCFNHVKATPIAKAIDPMLLYGSSQETTGVYLKDIKLGSLAFNTEYLWPCLKEGIISQLSVGAAPLEKPEVVDEKYLLFKKWQLFEGSFVSIAMNPTAILTRKGYSDFLHQMEDAGIPMTPEGILEATKSGLALPMLSKNFRITVPTAFGIGLHEAAGDNMPATQVTEENNAVVKIVAEGNIAPLAKDHKQYDLLQKALCADEKGLTLPLGGVGEEPGVIVLDKSKVIKSVSLLCGARGGSRATAEEDQEAALEKACNALRVCGLKPPVTKEGTSVDQAVFKSWNYEDLTWGEEEKSLLLKSELLQADDEFERLLRGFVKNGGSAFPFLAKSVYTYFSVSGYVSEEEDEKMAVALLEALFKKDSQNGDSSEIASPEYMDYSKDSLRKSLGASMSTNIYFSSQEDIEVGKAILTAIREAKKKIKAGMDKTAAVSSAVSSVLTKEAEAPEVKKSEENTDAEEKNSVLKILFT